MWEKIKGFFGSEKFKEFIVENKKPVIIIGVFVVAVILFSLFS